MNIKRGFVVAGILTALISFTFPVQPTKTEAHVAAPTFTPRVLVQGSTGGDIYELQGRLRYLGFYRGKVDGVFGRQTYWAVRNFQYRFGLKIDGVVGTRTKASLTRATKNYRATGQTAKGGSKKGSEGAANPAPRWSGKGRGSTRVSSNDLNLLANAVYGESRGEPYIGQVAVAAVILNRLESPKFPHSVPSIIFQPGAFTAVADGQIYLTPNQQAKKAVQDALKGWDPSGGAIYYFNPATATSKWIWSRPQIKRIGRHIFCR